MRQPSGDSICYLLKPRHQGQPEQVSPADGTAGSRQVSAGSLGEAYDAWHSEHCRADSDPEKLVFFNWALDLAAPEQGARLLDVACGDGTFLSAAAARGLEPSGIDLSPVAIESARTIVPSADLRVGDAENLPYEDSSFDIVTCLGSLEHFPSPERGAVEIARVVRPSGTVVVFLPNLFFLGHVWFGLRYGIQPSEGDQHFSETFRTSRGWTEVLEGSGLIVSRWEVWNKIHASAKVSRTTMRVWNIVSRFVPRNGAYGFAFVCKKGSPGLE
jgi:SAM-dependent methyltransferase